MLRNELTVRVIGILCFLFKTLVDAQEGNASTISVEQMFNSLSTLMYKQLATQTEENIFFCPLSVAVVVNILLIAAKNETAKEMRKFLGYDSSTRTEQEAFESLHRFLKHQRERQSQPGYELDVANSIWIQDTDVLSHFKWSVQNLFFAKEVITDFSDASSWNNINNWVQQETNGKIKSLFSERLSPTTRLLLINAVYFKGKWEKNFDRSDTKMRPFHSFNPMAKSLVPMMNTRGKFRYSENVELQSQVLELPYEGKSARMIIILPRKPDGLDEMEKNLSWEKLSEAISNMTTNRFNVFLPMFNVTSSLDLKEILMSLGVERIFISGVADLSGINGKRENYVSSVFQKTLIEVNEEGTVAAAASKVDIVARTITPDFTVNHPFMFAIEDTSSGVILFMGRVKRL